MSRDEGLRAVDEAFERLFAEGTIPGMAYGVVIAGDLVHARGLGTLHHGEDHVPDADSVFRIASMTKSFTASAVLLLRDEGALLLDEPVGTYVPELAGFRGATADSPLITVRHLLTMSSGLPTDDPWGDRLQGLPLDRVRASCWAAGSRSPGRRGPRSSTRTSATGSWVACSRT